MKIWSSKLEGLLSCLDLKFRRNEERKVWKVVKYKSLSLIKPVFEHIKCSFGLHILDDSIELVTYFPLLLESLFHQRYISYFEIFELLLFSHLSLLLKDLSFLNEHIQTHLLLDHLVMFIIQQYFQVADLSNKLLFTPGSLSQLSLY